MSLYPWHLPWVPERCGVGDRPFPKHSHFQRARGASERVASTEGKGSMETLENNSTGIVGGFVSQAKDL